LLTQNRSSVRKFLGCGGSCLQKSVLTQSLIAIPAIVETVTQRIDAPFYSVDIAQTLEGKDRIVELGDGQVSERKTLPLSRFVKMLAQMG
ncbi:ATP-grasp domain-containing protein, partial [Acaryochloris sp. IP29b_bin.137]|uniref:ATP-grasp domain-containing protein n=1 Tax=Acaryochloris sp. IP29b_bin.137 TaxID=2969217 RepID=UPI0026133EA4